MSVAPLIDKEYVATGKVRVVYRNFTVIRGDESVWAAEAALCAGDQRKFWEYHDLLFDNWKGENVGAFSKNNLKGFARKTGLDSEAFNSCLDSNKYYQQIQNEKAEGLRRGVQSTPTFFINDNKVDGLRPYESFRAMIEAELQRRQ